MSRIIIAAALALAAVVSAAPVQAQTFRTFVSTTGNDNNPCSITAPCRHFQAAVDVTPAGGEVDALDPGGYSSITISQAITIEGQGWSYIAPPTGGNGITITAGSGNVIIRGVSLNGVGVTGGTTGIDFTGGGTLTVNDSVIANFSTSGLVFNPTAASQILVSNTTFSHDGVFAIDILPAQSGANVTGSIDHVHESSTEDGLTVTVLSGNATINVTVSDSLFANNAYQGIQCGGDNAVANQVQCLIRNTTTANNGGVGIYAYNGATTWVTRSSIFGNATGLSFGNGSLISYGDNNLVNNTSPGSFSSTLTYQ